MGMVFALGFVMGVVGARVTTVAHRGGLGPTTAAGIILGALAMISTFAMGAWGFINLAWYWPIAVFLGATFISTVFISAATFPLWYRILPLLDIAAIAACVAMWWP